MKAALLKKIFVILLPSCLMSLTFVVLILQILCKDSDYVNSLK